MYFFEYILFMKNCHGEGKGEEPHRGAGVLQRRRGTHIKKTR